MPAANIERENPIIDFEEPVTINVVKAVYKRFITFFILSDIGQNILF